MKKLHKLIIGTYLGPFVLTFFITLFILVMQFLWKYIDELVGKGLEWYVIAELLFYASANLVPMALPLAILLSSIMTFGNLGEHYELVALKSSGLSLWRIMYPLILVILFTSMTAFYFSNSIWPRANLKFASLLYSIRHTKPALDIIEGIFYTGIDGYVIRVGEKEEDGQTLHDVIIYDHTEQNGNRRVIRARDGKMQMSEDERFLILTLYDGNSYDEIENRDNPLFRSSFREEIIRFDLSTFGMEKVDEELFKDNYQMLSLNQLDNAIDTLEMKLQERREDFGSVLETRIFQTQKKKKQDTTKTAPVEKIDSNLIPKANESPSDIFDNYSQAEARSILEAATNLTRSNKVYVTAIHNEFESKISRINRHKIEWHRKFTLSIACIVLFFIGAPLGAIIRKGGLGMPVIVSIIFFLIFHVSAITGEKLVKSGSLEPYQGMWIATAILLPIGVFLTYKATTDSALLDLETYSKFFKNLFRWERRLLKPNAHSSNNT